MSSPYGTVLTWDDHPWRHAWRARTGLIVLSVAFGGVAVLVGGIAVLTEPRLDLGMFGVLAFGLFLIVVTPLYLGPRGSGVRGLAAHVRRGRRRGGLQVRRSLAAVVAGYLVIAGLATSGVVMALTSDGWWNRAIGLGCLVFAPVIALGGGATSRCVLELTPTDISITAVARLAWSDLALFGPADQTYSSGYKTVHNAVIAMKAHDRRAITWANPFAMFLGRYGVPWDYDLVVAVRPFRCSPFLVLELIAFYGAHPEARAELATDSGLRRAELLWAGLTRAGVAGWERPQR